MVEITQLRNLKNGAVGVLLLIHAVSPLALGEHTGGLLQSPLAVHLVVYEEPAEGRTFVDVQVAVSFPLPVLPFAYVIVSCWPDIRRNWGG